VSIVLLIDTSGSMEPKLDKVRAAASTLFSRAVAGDDVCLMEFKTTVSVLQDFTTNTQTAQKALGGLKAGGGTALLDALKFAIEYAHRNGKNDRKGVVCITDGGEADSRCRREDVIPLLKQGNVQFYSIAFPDGLKPTPISNTQNVSLPKPQPSEAEARELMIILSQASGGGLLFFPQEADELPPITEAIVSNLRAPRYTITYQCSSPNTLTGWHSVRVLVHPAADTGGVTVHAREGYFAPETPPPSIPGGGISSRNEISR
jgi:Ca-activated chloride channel family protein